MSNIGDYVQHEKTRQCGKVIGYGHQILNSVYLPTLIVRVVSTDGVERRGFIEEDVSSVWMRLERKPSFSNI
jgi:hypothetical protein